MEGHCLELPQEDQLQGARLTHSLSSPAPSDSPLRSQPDQVSSRLCPVSDSAGTQGCWCRPIPAPGGVPLVAILCLRTPHWPSQVFLRTVLSSHLCPLLFFPSQIFLPQKYFTHLVTFLCPLFWELTQRKAFPDPTMSPSHTLSQHYLLPGASRCLVFLHVLGTPQ